MIWQLQEAKRKFSQVINLALQEGPQTVTRHGREVAVIISVDTYRNMVEPRPNLVEVLLNSPLRGAELEIERDRSDFGREFGL